MGIGGLGFGLGGRSWLRFSARADRDWFCAGIEINLVFVSVVEIDLISVWEIKLDLISV